MPEAREYYNVHILEVSESDLLKIRRAMHAHKIEIHIDQVIVPATNWNPTTGRFDL